MFTQHITKAIRGSKKPCTNPADFRLLENENKTTLKNDITKINGNSNRIFPITSIKILDAKEHILSIENLDLFLPLFISFSFNFDTSLES